ncbi:PREDICTED: high choriolytic enzyme 1-like, partial [Amphimedon queenslandica]|uniref:Metalloendopeptidase n=1 Tax=Amphimedon queenslandica TaxID=400682 RepID=A0AAN0JK49_AMPQE
MRLIIAIIICMIVNVISVEIPPADYFDENIENESCPEVERAEDEKDLVLIDGDILVSKEQAAIYYESGWDGLVNSEAWSPTKARWSKRIPYQVGAGISAPVTVGDGRIKANVENSIAELNGRTCLSFEAKTCKDTAFIKFVKGDACYTIELGKPNHGARTISLAYSCGGTAKRARTPAHEVMHTLGRAHEQTRSDRDDYVTIDARNTCSTQMAKNNNFRLYGIGYDFLSVMHYSQWQCAFYYAYQGQQLLVPSMIFKYKGKADDVGQRLILSDKDIQHIKAVHCPSMMMRLVGGRDNSEGRLEVNNEEVWGTVCSDGFDRNDANVVCKYLGRPDVEE